jgi:hypothetical protein
VPLVLILQSHRKEIMSVGRVMASAFMKDRSIDLAPDEMLLLTAACRYALPACGLPLAERMSTLVHYDADDGNTRHPVTWRSLCAADKAAVNVRSGRHIRPKAIGFPDALADAAMPANRSLFMRKVRLSAADVQKLLLKLQDDHWSV